MNIPLDRLYHYIRDIAQEIYGDRVIIYHFWPNGSKNINDLHNLNENNYQSLGPDEWYKKATSPLVWCNDQEPLNYQYYKENILQPTKDSFAKILQDLNKYCPPTNLNYQKNIFEKNLLLHSEKRSENLEQYQADNELIPVYYWSHALIARDWFRYAKLETFKKSTKKTFLIYNRAWAGTREYRLMFLEFLIRLDLQDHCQTSVNPIEPELGIHYDAHVFKNSKWRPGVVLEKFFPINTAPSHYSADFNTTDYNNTDIEVVLETLFDDSRLHLTEKSLRPIACGQPFILAGTTGSLEYLRNYGFKTFNHIWNEQYDHCIDPEERLMAIADLMRQIANWSESDRKSKMTEAQTIAEYNRQHFFSKEFFDLVVSELKTNLSNAFNELNQCNNYTAWIDRWVHLIAYPSMVEFLTTNQNEKSPTINGVNQAILTAQNKLASKK